MSTWGRRLLNRAVKVGVLTSLPAARDQVPTAANINLDRGRRAKVKQYLHPGGIVSTVSPEKMMDASTARITYYNNNFSFLIHFHTLHRRRMVLRHFRIFITSENCLRNYRNSKILFASVTYFVFNATSITTIT